ncbi:MAG: hypothetical protein HY289_05735 [Planctomycetes bacterium]|nr:hypothetical protein [Planctomycetota bacterium]
MKLLPYDSFTLETSEPIAVVAGRLTAKLDNSWSSWMSGFGLARWDGTFTGKVTEDGFKVEQVLFYRNSFKPVICGRFNAGPTGTVIDLTMRLNFFVVGFMTLWFGGIGAGFITVLPHVIARAVPWYGLPIFVLMWLLGYGLTLGCFWWEASRVREEITQLLVNAPKQHPPLRLLEKWADDEKV